ncbi:MAG: PCP reductase family protein, partial [Candidatus Binatia bacterium]
IVDGSVEWDAAARARMKEIPAFVRGMVSRRVETYCRDKGITRITPEILAEIRAKMPTPKLFGRS